MALPRPVLSQLEVFRGSSCTEAKPVSGPVSYPNSAFLVQLDSWEYEQPVGVGAVDGTWQGWKPLAAALMIKPSKLWSQDEKELELSTCFPPSLGPAVNAAFQLW